MVRFLLSRSFHHTNLSAPPGAGKSSSDAMLDRAMALMDPDGDGQITFEEFTRFWGEDGSGVDRLAKLEATIGGMLAARTTTKPKDGGSGASAASAAGAGRPRSRTDNGEENSDWSDDDWK